MQKRSIPTVLLLLVLALRSLLPHGYMVQAADASGGSFEIVICTSSGLQLLSVDSDGTAPPPKPQHVENGLCPFAAAGAAALAEAAPQSLARQAEYAAVSYALAIALFFETPKPGAASARGPPSQLTSASLA